MSDEPDSLVLRYLRRIDERLERLETDFRLRMGALEARFGALEARFSGIEARQAETENRLERIERRLDLTPAA